MCKCKMWTMEIFDGGHILVYVAYDVFFFV